MSKSVASVIWELAGLLNDREVGYEHVRWSKADLLEYINDAVMQAFLVRPQLFSHVETLTLVPGSLQEVPNGCTLQKILGADGASSPARKVDENMLAIYAGLACACSCGPYKIDGYSSNSSDPNSFWVDPPVPDDGQEHTAKIQCLQEPDDIEAVFDGDGSITAFKPETLEVKGKLHNAVIEWSLYRAYSVDMESPQSERKMQLHLRHFYEMLGLDSKTADKLLAEQMGKTKATPTANTGGSTS